MAGGGVGEAMLISAALGGVSSAAAGGDPLKGALLGGITGGIGSGVAGALGASAEAAGTAAAATAPATEAGITGLQTAMAPAATEAGISTLPQAATDQGFMQSVNPLEAAQNTRAIEGMSMNQFPTYENYIGQTAPTPTPGAAQAGDAASKTMWDKFTGMPLEKQLMLGSIGAMGLSSIFNRPNQYKPKQYNPYFTSFSPSVQVAGGGVMREADYLPGGGSDENFYATGGGIASLGSYSDGGRLLKGPGDGMSDNIPAQIGQHQPARLADGEFVVSSDVVSGLGNGSTDAGAKQLYSMMDRVRKSRTGTSKQGKQINPRKVLPA